MSVTPVIGPLVFVDIDTQRDFLEPNGALAIDGAAAIVPNLARLTQFARERGILVLATACAHVPDEIDPEPFPPHCLIGTPGQERVEATAWPGTVVVDVEGHWEGEELPPHLTLHKRRYDLFSHPEADRLVALYAKQCGTFVVYGVATDYCVRCAVEGLLARGLRVALVVDAIRAVDPSAEPNLLTAFVQRGVLLLLTDTVRGSAD